MYSSVVKVKTNIAKFTYEMLSAVDREVGEIAYEYRDRLIIELQSIKHGREYRSRIIKGNIHIASAPGESPGADSGDLEGSLKVSRSQATDRDWLESSVYSNSPYAMELEIGGRHYAARPMWIPVAESLRDEFTQVCTSALLNAAAHNQI